MKVVKCVLPLLVVASVVCALPACSETTKQESTGQYLDNSALTAKVKSNIFSKYPSVYTKVSVESYKGIVQLSGFVDSASEVIEVVDVVRHTSGVIRVENNLHVKY